MIMRRYYLIAMIGALTCFTSIVGAQEGRPSARTILTTMLAEYRGATFYQDDGVLRILPSDPSLLRVADWPSENASSSQTLVSFKTYFGRPGKFRFEWHETSGSESRSCVVWFDGKTAYSWTSNRTLGDDRFILKAESDVKLLIANAMKPSRGSVFQIPSLLMNETANYTFADVVRDLAALTIVGTELVDGEVCYVIKGNVSNVPWLLWIGKTTHLLRKLRSWYSVGSFFDGLQKDKSNLLVVEEIHHNIRINRRISNQIFRYRPPVRVGDVDLTR